MAERSRMMRMGWRKRALPAAAGLFVLVVMAVIHYFNPFAFQRFGDQLADQFQRWKPREYVDVGVRIVDIDEESIDRVGQWPWSRTQIAEMTARMFELTTPIEFEGDIYDVPAVGAVAFDIVFSEADRTSPENLRETLVRGGASEEVIAGLDSYVPHDFVLGRTLKIYSDQGLAVIMAH
ncbi:MAG: CHASE2 domain-containing protein, partial [Pseudomonadota bacterium]